MSPLRTSVAAGAARAAGGLSRLSGRGGTSLPGKILLQIDPRAIARLSARLPRGSVVISATNGKTTTAAMVASILERTGERLVHNRAGANMAGGIAATLLEGEGDRGLFEVDEFWLGAMVEALHPRATLLANLFRDQLDRYGELETIAERWVAVAQSPDAGRLVLNADDPVVADLGRDHGDAIFFGVEDDGVALVTMQHASDAKHCRRCGAPYVYDAHYMGHLGRYHCDSCGARRPDPLVRARDVHLRGIAAASFTLEIGRERAPVRLPLPGLYNVYNALGAAALAHALGIGLADIAAGLERGARRLRARGEHARRRARRLDHARQEPRRRQRGPAHARAGARRARPARGPQRRDRRRARRQLDLGRRLRGARRAPAAGHVQRLARRRDGAAPEVRGHPARSASTSRTTCRRRSTARVGDGQGRLFVLPTYTAMLALREELVARGAVESSFG